MVDSHWSVGYNIYFFRLNGEANLGVPFGPGYPLIRLQALGSGRYTLLSLTQKMENLNLGSNALATFKQFRLNVSNPVKLIGQ